MTVCPACGSNRVFRSKSRSAFERFRRQFTIKRPYRCHSCDWRGWAADGAQAVSPEDVIDAATPPPDLSAIDAALEESRKKPDG
jgi:predicted RNA-binding Zn-ribbon protein involved in translation (DUF1610 family)